MALRTGMYSALGDAFDQIRQSFQEAKMFDAQMRMNEQAAQRQHNQDMFNMEMMLEDRRKKQRAAQLFADYSTKLFSSNPTGNRQEELAQIQVRRPELEKYLRVAGPMANMKERLSIRQNISALNAREKQLMEELNNPKLIVDEFTALSSEANRAALEIAQFDPEQAIIFNRFAQSNQDQAKMYIDLLNQTKHGNDKTNAIKVYAKPGHPDFEPGALVTVYNVESGQPVPKKENETTVPPDNEKGTESTRSVTYWQQSTGRELDTYNISNKPGPLNQKRIEQSKKYDIPEEDIVTTQPKVGGAQSEFGFKDMVTQFGTDIKEGGIFGDVTEAGMKVVRDAMVSAGNEVAKQSGIGPKDEHDQVYVAVKEHFALADQEYWNNKKMIDNWNDPKYRNQKGQTFYEYLKSLPENAGLTDAQLKTKAIENMEEEFHKSISEMTGGKHKKFLPSTIRKTAERIGQ